MADFFFFTDADSSGLLNAQTSNDIFGAISDTEFRVTSIHTATSDPRAFAICDGEIAVQQDTDPNLINLILKPSVQVGSNKINIVPIRYFIYKGIKKSSLIIGTDLAPILTNHLTRYAFLAQEDMNRKREILENLPANSVVDSPNVNLLSYNITGTDDESLDKLFYKTSNSLFQNLKVNAGDFIGIFDKTKFGLEIISDEIRSQANFKQIGNVETRISSLVLGSSQSEIFKRKKQKEAVISFIDPAAFYGSLIQLGNSALKIYYRYSSDVIDLATPANDSPLRNTSGMNIYNDLLVHFLNKNKIYIDIRNEFNQSLNFLGQYDNNVQISIPEADNQLFSKDYYSNFDWPSLYLTFPDFDLNSNNNDTSNGRLTLKLQLPNPTQENKEPLIYVNQGHTNSFNKNDTLRGDKRYLKLVNSGNNTEAFKILGLNVSSESIITPVAQYIKIKYLKSTFDGTSSGVVPRANNYLSNIFLPKAMNLPYSLPQNTKARVYNDEVLLNLNGESGTQFMASVGIAEDSQNITLFAFAGDKFKTTSSSLIPTATLTNELSNELHYLNLVRDNLYPTNDNNKKEKLVQGSLTATENSGAGTITVAAKYLRFIDIFPTDRRTFTDHNLRNEFASIIFPKAKLVDMILDCGFSLNYDIYVRLQNEETGISGDTPQLPYTKYDLFLEGYNDDGTAVSLGIYNPGIKLYSYGTERNLILIDKDSQYDIATPIDTPADSAVACTGAFSQIELKYLKAFIAELSTSGPPFHDLYDKVFNIPSANGGAQIIVNQLTPLPNDTYQLVNPYTSSTPPTANLPKGFLAEACTVFAIYMFSEQLTQDTVNTTSNAGILDSDKSEIYRILKQVLIDVGFKRPISTDEKKDFNQMIRSFDKYIGEQELTFRGGNNIKNEMYKNMVLGNKVGNTAPQRFIFPIGIPVENVDILKSIDSILGQIGETLQVIIDRKSKCYYKILSGYQKSPTNLYLATGDGSTTSGLFNRPNNGVLLFNYEYDGKANIKNQIIKKFNSIVTENSTALHINMYGLDHLPPNNDSEIIIYKDGVKMKFRANATDAPIIEPKSGTEANEAKYDSASGIFYTETATVRNNIAKFDVNNRDLIFLDRNPYFSFEVEQKSNFDGGDYEECSSSINVIEGPKIREFEFEAENLFSNDIFVLTPTQESTLLSDSRYDEPINFLIDRLINVPNIPIYITLKGNFIGKLLDPQTRVGNCKIGKNASYQFHISRTQGRALETSTEDAIHFTPLRYSFGKGIITETDITIDIDSFVSPLWSRLDNKVPASQKATLDSLTRYYNFSSSDAYVDLVGGDPNPSDGSHPKLPSYNPILSALRSFGLIEAVKNNIIARANALGTYTPAQINTIKTHFETQINTTIVVKNDTLGISADVTHTHFVDFQ